MAEWALKIGDSREPHRYAGGDVGDVFNRRRIRLCHADMICHPRANGRKVGGQLGTAYPLLEKYYQRQCQYAWERVSHVEIRRTNLWTPGEIVYGSVPVEDPDRPGHMIHCHVEEHFAFRNKSKKLPIFGVAGRETEYGGNSKRDAATTELIWDDIEHDTPLRRVNHDQMPLSQESPPQQITLAFIDKEQRDRLIKLHQGEIPPIQYFGADRRYHEGNEGDVVSAILGGDEARHFLWISVDDFDDEEAEELKAPLTREITPTPENPTGIEIVKKRKYFVDWEADVAASLSNSATPADVRDRTKWVDIRAEETFARANIQQTKSLD